MLQGQELLCLSVLRFPRGLSGTGESLRWRDVDLTEGTPRFWEKGCG